MPHQYHLPFCLWNYEPAWYESTRAEEIGSRTIVSRNIWHKPDVDRGRSCLHKLRLKTASLSSVVGLRSRRWHALHCSTAGHLSEKEYFRGRYIHFAFSVCLWTIPDCQRPKVVAGTGVGDGFKPRWQLSSDACQMQSDRCVQWLLPCPGKVML